MLKDAFHALETGALAEISLVAFFVAFALIIIRVATLPKKEMDEGRYMPLDEPKEHYPADGKSA
jgi:hypothetical protein